ncbi:response regulator transcription factor [Candidatus Uabimicrobium amorphum]|uniref:Phosphate regulon transcriptional regulatory protein PhoB n=1 Tax=Uabimicrobium amorphum TaxID=2596890 RepID=A0A5S9IUE0_UABAM|nr:response regulator transcription factor [Candidatus Uabimicrobium amorphum]BBM87350.1 DNA-binding response regulator [Candidatus Uabimicrobium amorphum]
METILVVEDDPAILLGLTKNLQFEGFNVLCAEDGEEALEIIFNKPIDLLLLDVMLPKLNGFEVCKTVRKKNLGVPIIMLTAKDKEIDKIMGLDLGADDYIAKPFSVRELIARINAVLRRKRKYEDKANDVLLFGNIKVNFQGRTVHKDDERVDLSPKEFDVLKLLVQNKGKVLSREEILNKVWGYDYFGTARTVDNFINKLRQKIEEEVTQPLYILTVRGIGYKFQIPE